MGKMAWIFRRIFVVALATATLSLGLSIAPAVAGNESNLVSAINAERSAAGKQPLQVYWDLRDDALDQAKAMRDQQNIFHHPNLGSVTSGWTLLGENVGAGPSISGIMTAFMGSSTHRSNILNGGFNYVGAGVAEDAAGRLWVSVIFMQGPDDLLDPPDTTTTTTTQPPTTTTTTQPPSTTTTTQPPFTTTTTQPPGGTTTTTTQPPSTTTTTTQPPGGTTTTTLPPDGGTDDPTDAGDTSGGGGDPGTGSGAGSWGLYFEQFEVLSPNWLNPSLLRIIGFMAL
jgi:hypothetical protein